MNKAIILLVLAALLGTMSPVLAVKPLDKVKPMENQLGVGLNNAPSTQAKAQAKYVRRPASIQGELMSMSGIVLPATLTVKVNKVAPKKNKKWAGAYPEVKEEVVVWVDANTKFVRKYWGKSSLEELTVGDKLDVRVKTNEDSTVTATLVKDDTLHWTWKVHNGVIEGLDATNKIFTLKQFNSKTATVKVNDKTKIWVPPYTVAGSAFVDLQDGQIAHIRGIINNKTKIITASYIRVGIVKPPLAGSGQAVEAVTSTTATTTQ